MNLYNGLDNNVLKEKYQNLLLIIIMNNIEKFKFLWMMEDF